MRAREADAMPDYEPIDLSHLCNAGTAFISPEARPPIGSQLFHGLPFAIAEDPARCFIGFGGEPAHRASVTVSLGRTARRVLFAHGLLESGVMEGENFGRVVAQYVFRYAEGEEVRVPIRERFEVGVVVPAQGGGAPFLAVPDQKELLMPRYEGRWEAAGRRQTEASRGGSRGYTLWAWENPQPDRVLASVTLEPADRKFFVAAITLAHGDESPFYRTGKQAVKITLPQPEDAAKPFLLEVDVDRGVATYPFPLPEQEADAFLGDDFRGWGEAQNAHASPAYVEVAAIPSATLTVKNDGEELGKANWGELQEKRTVETPRVRLELADRGKNWVHVTVLDDETGRPIPCRVHFRCESSSCRRRLTGTHERRNGLEKMTPKRKPQPLRLVEVVDDLFPPNEVVLTAEQIAYYRQVGAFAFACDRQSLDTVLEDPTKTGQESRVYSIREQARWLKVYLPAPRENPNWLAGGAPQPGELQYYFNDPDVRPFWFVDGTARRASGYIINQRSRPELWRAYHTAIRLAEAGCPVRAFIVGEATRFFRTAKWIILFAEGLWAKQIGLYVMPFGEITPHTIGAYVRYVQALSGRLQEHLVAAREAYRRRCKVFNRRCQFGLMIDREADHPVQANRETWPILFEMCHLIADGTLPRGCDVRKWLLETHGVNRGLTWIGEILRDRPGILDGIYRIYRYSSQVCEREDPSGLVRDIAVTENGNRRYKRTVGPGEVFEIYFPPGTQPIPGEIVEAARARILCHRGRPPSPDSRRSSSRALGLVPPRLLRCAHCGCGVCEFNPEIGTQRKSWRLRCSVVTRLMQRYPLTAEEARTHPMAQHTTYWLGQVSAPLWELLVDELTRQAPPPRADAPDAARERLRLQDEQRQSREDLEAITANFLLLRKPSPQVVAVAQRQQAELEQRIKDLQHRIQLLAADVLAHNHRIETFTCYQERLGQFLGDPDLPIEKRREVVEAMVQEVTIDLETGEFTVAIRTPQPVLRRGAAIKTGCSGA
jgi:hypothetical protein